MEKKMKMKTKVINKLLRLLYPFVSNRIRILILRKSGVTVGRDVVITAHTKISSKLGYEYLLSIGDRAAIGADHLILTSDPSNSNLLKYKDKYPFIEVFGKIEIKNDAWIGAGAIILPDVVIGECSIVASGAVVTKDVAPYTVVAGIPATKIRDI
jgi:acetyltransferase-like isoleucine patch superfamily enzyme